MNTFRARETIENVKNGDKNILSRCWVLLTQVLLNFSGSKPRTIKDIPIGFDEQDVKMANPKSVWKSKNVAKFLAPSSQNEENTYQIGIAFVGRDNISLGCGHAEIIIRDGDGLRKIRSQNNLDLTIGLLSADQDDHERTGPQTLLEANDIRLRVLHLRNANDKGDSLELVLETRREVRPYRYDDLYRICTTERQLKHIALRSCPEKYTVMVDDCATFCHSFLEGLLDHLLERGKSHRGIDEDEYSAQKLRIKRLMHIKDGLAGKGEWRAISPAQGTASFY